MKVTQKNEPANKAELFQMVGPTAAYRAWQPFQRLIIEQGIVAHGLSLTSQVTHHFKTSQMPGAPSLPLIPFAPSLSSPGRMGLGLSYAFIGGALPGDSSPGS
jgi:hypothetical protein